ncbi:hypothetical protein BGW38_005833, partial [Lunasporangiospora selenospora]
ELSHFHLLRSVGKGAFGKVRVVQHKKTKEIYALKYINKAKCIRMRAVENIIQERRLLEEVEFSLICNLRYAFQDDEHLFMILDLMLGGDLRFHLERAGPMREEVVRFYIAELALALDFLHSRRIIHRDLKPDNVLLDEHGHAHLTDFNIAVYYSPSKPLTSIAGSMAYMAPEVLLRKGYQQSVDWWSLGVVMFELLFGKRPFRGKTNDLLTNSILRDPLPFPDNVRDTVSAPCLDVLSKLCDRDVTKRLGCTSEGIDAVKSHPWFTGIEWDKLSKQANFDATHELEELLMEDNPLKVKKRVQITSDQELSTEMRMMEDRFTIYDSSKVRRSQSFSRSGKALRSASQGRSHDRKASMSSTTLDNTVMLSRNSSGRIEQLPMINSTAPTKVHRPSSPSDLVGQDRFNPEEDHVSSFITASVDEPQSILHIAVSPIPHFEDNPVVAKGPGPLSMPLESLSASNESAVSTPVTGVPPTSAAPWVGSALCRRDTDSTLPSSTSDSSVLSTPPTTLSSSPAIQKPGLGSSTVAISPLELAATPQSSGASTAEAPPPAVIQVDGVTIAELTPSETAGSEDTVVVTTKTGKDAGAKLKSHEIQSFPEHTSVGIVRRGTRVGRAFELSGQGTRPMSVYTTSNAGSIHGSDDLPDVALRSFSPPHQSQHRLPQQQHHRYPSYRASISGPDDLTAYSSSEGGSESTVNVLSILTNKGGAPHGSTTLNLNSDRDTEETPQSKVADGMALSLPEQLSPSTPQSAVA